MSGKDCGIAGLFFEKHSDPSVALVDAKGLGYNFICIGPMLKPSYVAKKLAEGESLSGLAEPFAWFDLSLQPADWSYGVVGRLTNLNSQLESPNQDLANTARNLLMQEIEFSKHLSLPALIVTLPRGESHINLAKLIHDVATTQFSPNVRSYAVLLRGKKTEKKNDNDKSQSRKKSQKVVDMPDSIASIGVMSLRYGFWICVPITYGNHSEENNDGDGDGLRSNGKSSWNAWNRFRFLCNFDVRVSVCLELTQDLPCQEVLSRWLGEPVKCIIVPTNCFVTNPKGFPVLSRAHQNVVKQFMLLGAQVVIKPPESESSVSVSGHRQYLQHIYMSDYRHMGPSVIIDGYAGIRFTSGYEDNLQFPLQPLQDNLESATYDVFEKDPVKYKLYEDAICQALMDMVSEADRSSRVVVLMVVGAGRGPLVRSSFRASERSGRRIKVYAIEKNRNAANTIHYLNAKDWNGRVTVVNMDMREWESPEKADILVSELLGSFGDNELSPECLDGAQKFLKPGGIMIPQSYRSYISPIMSSKLFNEVRKLPDITRTLTNFETPYVVHIKNHYKIAKPQLLFSFDHPKKDVRQSNDRYGSVTFQPKEDCVIHGFAGYFESNLYKDVVMSILPETFSEGMFSWFPIFFPMKEPIDVRQTDKIIAHFWRCGSKKGVWYEWTITEPVAAPIHNPLGRSYTIGV